MKVTFIGFMLKIFTILYQFLENIDMVRNTEGGGGMGAKWVSITVFIFPNCKYSNIEY